MEREREGEGRIGGKGLVVVEGEGRGSRRDYRRTVSVGGKTKGEE